MAGLELEDILRAASGLGLGASPPAAIDSPEQDIGPKQQRQKPPAAAQNKASNGRCHPGIAGLSRLRVCIQPSRADAAAA